MGFTSIVMKEKCCIFLALVFEALIIFVHLFLNVYLFSILMCINFDNSSTTHTLLMKT